MPTSSPSPGTGTPTPVSAIGEFGLIERFSKILRDKTGDPALLAGLVRGIGDDAAVFRPAPGNVLLVTTDAFAEGIHFDLTYTSMKHLGWKVVAASASDIAAMGGSPRFLTLTVALPGKISVEMLEELYDGIAAACREFRCAVIGGDTIATAANMELSATVIGEAAEGKVVYRGGAQPGDLLCVSGHLGASLAGLRVFQREKKRFLESGGGQGFEPRLEPYAAALEKHLMPRARFDIAALLTEHCTPHAMIDISDGLASEVHHLCAASRTGASVYEHNLPVTAVTQQVAAEHSESPTDYALYGGDEFELLFTLTDEDFERLEDLTSDVTIIGRITAQEEGILLVREDGRPEPLKAGGWNHFTQGASR